MIRIVGLVVVTVILGNYGSNSNFGMCIDEVVIEMLMVVKDIEVTLV